MSHNAGCLKKQSIIFCFLFITCSPTNKQFQTSKGFSKKLTVFQTWVKTEISKLQIPAVKIVMADFRGNKPHIQKIEVGPSTTQPFSVASITKTLTALAILKQVEKGNLALDAKVSDILPGFHGARKELHSEPIRIRHLLSHTSGLAPGLGLRKQVIAGKEMNIPVQIWPTGTRYFYANINYHLLARILEKITNTPYARFMNHYILPKLNMKHSYFIPTATGASGLMTTVQDLTTYMHFWINRNHPFAISDDLWQEMLSPVQEPPPIPAGIYRSLTWQVEFFQQNKVYSYSHEGRWYRVLCLLKIYPEKKFGFIFTSQPEAPFGFAYVQFRQQLEEKLTELSSSFLAETNPLVPYFAQKPGILLEEYPGYYKSFSGNRLFVRYANQNLYLGEEKLIPIHSSVFYSEKLGNVEFLFRQTQVYAMATRFHFWIKE
ncbi:MAG: class A beta-lactamase-related serine hydrolase [Candidatus Hydrogenedentota bacterium]|nr:MAG: class A beta-lactamase-related serine hydrolase [Candidatus Hydrogenedentota bacterium]